LLGEGEYVKVFNYRYLVLFFSCTIQMLFMRAQEKVFLRIDNAFSRTSYGEILNTCMKVYADLLLLEELSVVDERAQDVLDMLTGRLVRLHSYVQHITTMYRKEAILDSTDIAYLFSICEYFEVKSPQLIQDDIPVHLNVLIDEIKKALAQLRENPVSINS
jgi:hypothetical protein